MNLNEKGGVDTYIATIMCITMLLAFVGMCFALMTIMVQYTALQRTLDLAVTGIASYGGYTEDTHKAIQSYLEPKGIKLEDVEITATNNGSILSKSPIKYGDGAVDVTINYNKKIAVNFLGASKKTYNFTLPVRSTAISQYVPGAVPEQCYGSPNGLSLDHYLSCDTPDADIINSDLSWE